MRSLIIVRVPPYPPLGGGALRNWQNSILLAQQGPVKIFSIYAGRRDIETLPNGISWQHADLYASPRSRRSKIERRLQWIRPRGVAQVDWVYKEDIAQQLHQCLQSFHPDLVVFGEIWLYRYLATVQRYGCWTILDNHNLEADKESYRQTVAVTWQERLAASIQLRQVKAVERAFIEGVTQTWLCSREDQTLLKRCYGDYPSWVIPNGVDVAFYEGVRQGQVQSLQDLTDDVPMVLFLAKFSYGPNQEAVEVLTNQIYPLLAQHYPRCRLLLVGKDPTRAMLRLAKHNQQIVVTGMVPDVRPYLAAAQVMVVPLRQGGGTRLKILEAFAAGCPVVSTAKGAEGLQVQDGQHLLLRESAVDLAMGIMSLWEDEVQRQQLASAAWELVNRDYSRAGVGQQLQQAVLRLERS